MGTTTPQKSTFPFFVIVLVSIGFAFSGAYLQGMIEENRNNMKQLDRKVEEQGVLLGQKAKDIEQLNQQNILLETQNKELEDVINQQASKINQQESQINELQKTTEELKTTTMPSRGETIGGQEFYVEASAYTAYCSGCSGKTKWGELDLRANPNYKVIAVDPNIIPLGTKVHVEGYGYAIAADTGGAIKGYKVDLFYPDKQQAIKWGRQKVKIKILN